MQKTLTITQGDHFFIRIPLMKSGSAWPILGWKFWWTMKSAPTDADPGLVQKSTDGGTIKTLSLTSVYVLGEPDDTKALAAGKYFYDVQAQSPEGDIYTLEKGIVKIDAEITQAD